MSNCEQQSRRNRSRARFLVIGGIALVAAMRWRRRRALEAGEPGESAAFRGFGRHGGFHRRHLQMRRGFGRRGGFAAHGFGPHGGGFGRTDQEPEPTEA